jgi:DNA polymerase
VSEKTLLHLVFGVGNPNATVMFIGEGPGFDEDRLGEPFVGKAGQLLDKILSSIGLDRTKVYIANIVKCHPMVDPSKPDMRGNDRPPQPEEMDKCLPFLIEQIGIVRPSLVVTLGATATKALLQTSEGITRIRGQLREMDLLSDGTIIKVLPTYHPATIKISQMF